MTWKQRYKARSYLRSSLWIVPVAAGLAERMFRMIVEAIEPHIQWQWLELGIEGAKALTNTVITISMSFVVFTFGSLLVAIQVASGQYTPRIIATTLLRDNVIRYTAGIFIFTFIFAVKAAGRMGTSVHQLVAFITALLGLICIVGFLYLIDHAAKMLRPVSLVQRVGEHGLAVIESVYP